MPRAAQWIAEILPLTHFIRIIRSVMLRGADLMQMNADMGALALFALVALMIAILRFNKRLD